MSFLSPHLVIEVGLVRQYQTQKFQDSPSEYLLTRLKPQQTTSELRLPVQVFSGVKPPIELLEAMANARPPGASWEQPIKAPPLPARKPVHRPDLQTPVPSQHSVPMHPSGEDDLPLYNEDPPSYEDSIAHGLDLSPVDGMGRDYAPPIPTEDPLFSRDAKH